MRVETTLLPEVQRLAERVVRETLAQAGEARGVGQAALVAMRPDGSVVAMVGGRDYGESQFNRAADAMRQPGSAFKLFVYYAALRNGYSPDDMIDASPVEVGEWEPENYGGEEYGYLTLSRAFARSVNSAAVRLGMTVGLDEVAAAARELGLDAPLVKVPSMALGTNEVSLLDLTGAFASVRAGTPGLEPWGISAFGAEGTPLRALGAPRTPSGTLPRRDDLTRLLQEVVEHGTGRAAALYDDTVRGKTGTSQDYRDAWFVGFNSSLIVGVWVGNDDRTPMRRVTGGSLPAQIWQQFVREATPQLRHMDAPPAPQVASFATTDAQCDYRACAAAYSSFRPSDCTYQPYNGPRRLCERGVSMLESRHMDHAYADIPRGYCDIDRCSRRYRSFDPVTCTYQPYGGGPRRMCGGGSAWE
jgi:membrane peptidoglycan carboxypeptidase